MKRIFAFLLALGLLFSLALAEEDVDETEKSGSWAQINQSLTPRDDWQQYVQDRSAFALGEGTPYADDERIMIRSWGTWPSMDGSTVCVPMAMEITRQWLGLQESDLNGFINFSTTPNAIARLVNGTPNPMVTIQSENAVMDDSVPVTLYLGVMPNEDSRALAEENGVTLKEVPVCYDAFVFLVNGANPVDSLTLQQIRDIYTLRDPDSWDQERIIENWSEILPEYDMPIYAYERPHGSGSQNAMEEMVMQGLPIYPVDEADIVGGMSDLIRRVGNYDNCEGALGYSYLYYVDELYKSGDIKVLAIDGIAPTPENLRSGDYPLTVCYYAVYREEDENAARFVEWLLSDEGQASIAQASYITLR